MATPTKATAPVKTENPHITDSKPATDTKPAENAPETAAKPGRKPGQKAKEYDFSALSLEALSAPAAVTEELASKAAPTRTRDEKQLVMDKVVKQVHADWIAAEKPAAWAKMPKAAYAVDPKAVEGLQYLINRAASFHGLAVRYGSAVRDANGRQLVVFAVRDRHPREAKPEAKPEAEGKPEF